MEQHPQRFVRINADQTPAFVWQEVLQTLKKRGVLQ
jgi:hypothetical protein